MDYAVLIVVTCITVISINAVMLCAMPAWWGALPFKRREVDNFVRFAILVLMFVTTVVSISALVYQSDAKDARDAAKKAAAFEQFKKETEK